MDQPIELLQSVARSCDSKALGDYLNFCSESKLFCLSSNKREANVTFLNSLLSSKDNYIEGISILDIFLEQCPKDLLSANIVSWIQYTVKSLVNPEDSSLCPNSWKVLGKLIQLSTDFPEARKNIALNVIPKVLDHILREAKTSKEEYPIFLQCLENTLSAYGKSCGFHKEAITALIFTHLEASPSSIFLAGKCFLNLAACGSPGAGGDNYASSWLKQQQFLLNSLHSQLNVLFENINEVKSDYKRFQLEEAYPVIPKVTEKGFVRKKQRQVKQFQSLAEFLKIMLLGKFPVHKKILPESLLSLIWRGLVTNNETLKKFQHSIDTSSLATVISTVNLASLELLDALVISCKMNLLPFSSLICRIFSQTLKWTSTEDWPFGITKPNSYLRVKIYECLCNWLTVSRACSGIDKYNDDIVHSILSDIHHEPPTVALKVPGKGKKNKSKITEETNPLFDFIINPKMNAGSCEAALKCASVLLNSSSTLLKPDHHRRLQEAIVSEIILIQQCKMIPPYSHVKCRLALYEALLSLCQNSHSSFPPPINYASELLSNGIKDSSHEVSSHCLFAMRNIANILHPVCPTIDFPISHQNLPMINVTANETQEEGYLLNDESARKRRMKRKRDQQVTSTPVQDSNQSKRPFIADTEKSFLNDSSVCVNEEMHETTHEDNSVLANGETGGSIEDTKSNCIPEVSEGNGTLNGNKFFTEEKRNNRNDLPDNPSTSEEPNIEGKSFTEEEIHNESENNSMNVECSPLGNSGVVDNVVDSDCAKNSELNEDHEVIDSAANDSENEMLNSFVDEVA